jgi:hypothetical protein
MNPHDLLTRADLLEFEKRFYSKLSEYISEITTPTKNSESDDFLSRKQVMQMFDVSDNTFQEIIKEGLPYIVVGKRARYNRQEVINFLKGISKFKL